jgi:hypothetical protein
MGMKQRPSKNWWQMHAQKFAWKREEVEVLYTSKWEDGIVHARVPSLLLTTLLHQMLSDVTQISNWKKWSNLWLTTKYSNV